MTLIRVHQEINESPVTNRISKPKPLYIHKRHLIDSLYLFDMLIKSAILVIFINKAKPTYEESRHKSYYYSNICQVFFKITAL